jgi:hypothetical protein
LLVDEEEEPLGLLEEDAPPLMPPVELDEDPPGDEPLIAPPLPDEEPPMPPALEPVVPPLDEVSVGLVVVVDDEAEPPGVVSFFSVVVVVVDELDAPGLVPPGTTVVVSFFSHADNASALNNTSR